MSKFKRGCVYTHLTSKDLDIYVVQVPYFDSKRSKLKIRWVSKTSGQFVTFPGGRIDGITNIEISEKDYKYWSLRKK